MQICKLPIMQKNIMSSASNATRFLVLGHNRCERTGADNTLMTICIDHKPGAMAGALGVLAKHSNNVCAVESYPDRCVLRFFGCLWFPPHRYGACAMCILVQRLPAPLLCVD